MTKEGKTKIRKKTTIKVKTHLLEMTKSKNRLQVSFKFNNQGLGLCQNLVNLAFLAQDTDKTLDRLPEENSHWMKTAIMKIKMIKWSFKDNKRIQYEDLTQNTVFKNHKVV